MIIANVCDNIKIKCLNRNNSPNRVISYCNAKMSVRLRSYRSAQTRFPGLGLDELRGDADAITGLAYAAFRYVPNPSSRPTCFTSMARPL